MAGNRGFSAAFEARLRDGKYKYADWVLLREFTEDHLLCLLCMIGEFDACVSELMPSLWDDWARLRGQHRSILALEAMHRMVRGERFDRMEWARRIGDGRMQRGLEDLPEPVRAAASRAAPGIEWSLIMMIAEGYELGGKDGSGQAVYVYLSGNGELIHAGAERRRGEESSTTAFPESLVGMIERDQRARWAIARVISEEHLLCLLCLAGEFEARSHQVLLHLDAQAAALPDSKRAVIALNAMHCMVRFRERFDIDELERRFSRGRGHLKFGDLPDALRAALDQTSPGTQWTYVWMSGAGYILIGKDATGTTFEVSVSASGVVEFNM